MRSGQHDRMRRADYNAQWLFGVAFAELWRNAQQRRSTYIRLWIKPSGNRILGPNPTTIPAHRLIILLCLWTALELALTGLTFALGLGAESMQTLIVAG